MKKINNHSQSGMALVTVLIFTAVALIVIVMGVTLSITQVDSAVTYSSGQEAILTAESAAENALIRLLRNPNYAGETLTFENGTATIVVSGVSPNKQIDVTADVSSSVRKLRIGFSDVDGILQVNTWQEVF